VLKDDMTAWRIVIQGTAAHHEAARQFIRTHSPKEWAALNQRELTSNREIISKGRCQTVTDAEIEELRAANVSWYVYCQKRLTANHADALSAMLKHANK
jgi:hypothetical protein